MRDKPKPKRSKPQVWERTLWAIQQADGTLLDYTSTTNGEVDSRCLFRSRRAARDVIAHLHKRLKPVKVRERIEVLG